MYISTILIRFIGLIFLAVGLSALNRKFITAVMNEAEKSPALFWLMGLVTVMTGAIIIAFYGAWSCAWQVFITVIGYLFLIKGAVIMIFPKFIWAIYKRIKGSGWLALRGLLVTIIGLLLVYMGFFA